MPIIPWIAPDLVPKYIKGVGKKNSINGKGVKPDVEVNLSEEYKNNPVRENDNQLQKAIELLK